MNANQKTNTGIRGGTLLWGIIVAVTLTLVSAVVLAGLEINETIDETKSLYLPYGVPVLSAWGGCMFAAEKGRGACSSLLTALAYGVLLLLCGLLGFGGELTFALTGLLLAAVGMAFALLTQAVVGGKRRRPINGKRYRR